MLIARRNRDNNSDVHCDINYHTTIPKSYALHIENNAIYCTRTSTITFLRHEITNCASTRGRLYWKYQVLLALLVVDKNGLYKTDHRWLKSFESTNYCIEWFWLKNDQWINTSFWSWNILYVFDTQRRLRRKQKSNCWKKDRFYYIIILIRYFDKIKNKSVSKRYHTIF